MPGHLIASEPLHQGVRPIGPFSSTIIGARLGDRGSHHGANGQCSGFSRVGSRAPRQVPRGIAALAALTPTPAVAQRTPQPIFTELFAYDPAAPSQLLGKLSRADAIAAAEAQAIARATEAGADPATIAVVEVEDMPLAYLPGNALRVRVRVAGEMRGGE